MKGHTNDVTCLIKLFGQPGKKIASASEDTKIKIWDLETDECIKTLESRKAVSCLVQLGDVTLASGGYNSKIKIWYLETGDCIKELVGHKGSIRSMVKLKNGLATGSADTTIRVWA